MSAETMKIPEPIMEPTTRAVASSREIALTKSVRGCCVVAIGWLLVGCRAGVNLVAPAGGRHILRRRRLQPRGTSCVSCRGKRNSSTCSSRSPIATRKRRTISASCSRRGPAPEGVKQLTEVIERMVGVLGEGVGRLKKGDDVMRYCIEAKQLEEEGDAIYHESLGRLFEKERDALEIIKWKEIYDNLEQTLDQSEDVANVLESITLKHA